MPRGGPRPGAGRPKGSKAGSSPKKARQEAQQQAQRLNMTPLEYMLNVVNDPNAPDDRRDKMALGAAPYVHAKAGEKGKKDQRDDDAKRAGEGSEWGDDLQAPGSSAVN